MRLFFGKVFAAFLPVPQTTLAMKTYSCPGKHILPLFFLFAVLFLSACATPQVVTKLEPEAQEGYVEHGREYITLSNDSIYAILGFDGVHDEVLIFDLVVVNNCHHPFRINPSGFYYERLDSALEEASSYPLVHALGPDEVSGKYDESIAEMQSVKSSNAFFGILDAATNIVFNTAGFISTEDPGYLFDLIAGSVDKVHYYVTTDKQIEEDMSRLIDEKKLVRQATHEPRTLGPGESASGFVFFPQNSDADYYMFCFPLDNELFQFVYHQEFALKY